MIQEQLHPFPDDVVGVSNMDSEEDDADDDTNDLDWFVEDEEMDEEDIDDDVPLHGVAMDDFDANEDV